MKKFLAIAAAAALLLCCTACGGNKTNTSDTSGGSSVTSGDNGSGAAGGNSGAAGGNSGTAANGSDDKDSGMSRPNNNDITDGNTESNAPDGFIDPTTGEGALTGGTNDAAHRDEITAPDGTADGTMAS